MKKKGKQKANMCHFFSHDVKDKIQKHQEVG